MTKCMVLGDQWMSLYDHSVTECAAKVLKCGTQKQEAWSLTTPRIEWMPWSPVCRATESHIPWHSEWPEQTKPFLNSVITLARTRGARKQVSLQGAFKEATCWPKPRAMGLWKLSMRMQMFGMTVAKYTLLSAQTQGQAAPERETL